MFFDFESLTQTKTSSWIKFQHFEETWNAEKMARKIKTFTFFKFLPLFGNQWAWKPVKLTQHMRIPSCDHKQHHNWSLGTDFRLENGHIQPLEWPEKSKFCHFFKFLPIFFPILVLFGSLVGYLDMPSCFLMFVCVYQWTRGVKNELDQKMSYLGLSSLMKSSLKETSSLEPLGINFFGLSMHFPHKLGKRDGKINWIGRSEQFGTFWATL